MASQKSTLFLVSFFVSFSILHESILANQKSYIVYMGGHSHGPEITKDDLHKVSTSHIDILAKYTGSKEKASEGIFESYRRYINGFAAHLDENVANELRKDPKVVSVFVNEQINIQTTHSWKFLSVENENLVPSNSLWKMAKYGEDIIIGGVDTGVWPESKSFSDEGYGPVPLKWRGTCEKGVDATFACNRKLIGARFYKNGYETVGKINASQVSPRDFNGHGTHILSTAGGNFVSGIQVPGLGDIGTAKGGAPRARVAAYKACWEGTQCFSSDILKAMDHAIYEGVHVLSISLGFTATDYMNDPIAIGAMHAVYYDINVVVAGGNSGPGSSTVTNVAPWMLNVAASTIDRQFQSVVELGNGLRLKGESISDVLVEDKLYPLVTGEQAQLSGLNSSLQEMAKECILYLDREKVKGKILVCNANSDQNIARGYYAREYGAVGLIVCNSEAFGAAIIADMGIVPSSFLTYKDGLTLLEYLKSTSNPMGVIKRPTLELGVKPAPMVAIFSSRGPNTITHEILKPDITAPGVNIVAACSGEGSPTTMPDKIDSRRLPYVTKSGTSMATPHVSGIVALLRAIYPKWSVAAIQSAIITTANPLSNTGVPIPDSNFMDGTPFSYGAGEIQPQRVRDPGLIYELHMKDYLNFLCGSGYNSSIMGEFYRKAYQCPLNSDEISLINFNYPSITIPKLEGNVTVKRRVKNVGPASTYKAQVIEPQGISVLVQPDNLVFKKTGEHKSFSLTITTKGIDGMVPGKYMFGALIWSDGVRNVRSPITVAVA